MNWLLQVDQGLLVDVKIGDFVEKDIIITGFWPKSDYITQWIDAIDKIISGGDGAKSALATAVHDPSDPKRGFVIHWWPLYREGVSVYVRNGSIPYAKDNPPIDIKKLYSLLDDRESTSKEIVSEWATDINELALFKRELQNLVTNLLRQVGKVTMSLRHWGVV